MIDTRTRLPPALHDPVSEQGQKQRYAEGQILFREGDASNGLYVLLSGKLKVYANSADGREVVYNIMEPGELFGELSLGGGPRTASVRAMSDAECLILKNPAARDLMRTCPEFADHVFIKINARAERTTHMIRSIALDKVSDRVIALLSESATADGNVWRVPSELTQQEIANRIGASREMVLKVIRNLVHRGFIRKDEKHRMTILRPLSEARRAD